MYCMPIMGTSARLYFPNESSEDPIVTGCVRNNGSGCQKTSDTTKRYLGTEHGSEVEMTPNALNVRGKEPVSISFDDNVGVTITSHQKLTINADDDIIMKTPKNVKMTATSQLVAMKTGTKSGFSMETDVHFLSNNVIRNGRDSEAFAAIENTPSTDTAKQQETKKEEKKEEKKGFNWGKLFVAAVAVVAVAASIATFGIGAVLVGAAIGACIGAASGVIGTAISDKMNGTHSSLGTYVDNALKGAFTGAVSGAIFGPFGAFESLSGVMVFGGVNGVAGSVLTQAVDGEFSLEQTIFDGLIGAATGGLLHGMGKVASKASPYITKSIQKVLSKASSDVKPILSKLSGKADDILRAFDTTSRELFESAANRIDNVVTSIKNSAQNLVDRAANKFNEVTTAFDNKVDDLLLVGASKLDDGLNVLNQARYNVRKAFGLEKQLATDAGPIDINNPPEETSFFKDKIYKMTANGDENIENIASKVVDISDNFDLEVAKEYERKIDNSKYFYHDEGDFGEEVTGIVGSENGLGEDVSSLFHSGRNGIDKAFISEGPPPKLTMIESKASKKGQFSYSSQQMKGGKQYFDDMLNSKDARYANFKKTIKKLEKENPGLIYDYISVETKVKITDVGFGVDEISVKDWTKPID